MLKRLSEYFDAGELEKLARQTKFTQRKSKLSGGEFLNALMFVHQQGKDLSLLDICGDLYEQCGIKIRKQSLQDRFNDKAVKFMKAVLSKILSDQLKCIDKKKDKDLSSFGRIRIKDSTRFKLPDSYAGIYQGHGKNSGTAQSQISIQYEYDLLSGNTMDLRLTPGKRNDQTDSKKNTHKIAENDLFIRDLGYATLDFMSRIIAGGAYFLNRLNPMTKAYYADNPEKEVDFAHCYKRMKKYGLDFLEYDVVLGKDKIPSRLIIYPVDKKTYEKRIRKIQKYARRKGHKVSEEYKTRAKMTIYVTNVGRERIAADRIKDIYGLRWQIELTFKIWKSQGKINQIKEMKIHRFRAQLLAKLIWLLIHKQIFSYLTGWINYCLPDKTPSIWKYYKHAYRINATVRKIIFNAEKLSPLLLKLMDVTSQLFLLETKKGKQSHYESLMTLN